MIVKVDAQDFVISVEPEAVDSAMRDIRRSEAMPEATQTCRGPWHYKNGQGTVLPHSAFSQSTRKPGFLNKTCDKCLEQNRNHHPHAGRVGGKNLKTITVSATELPKRYQGNPVLPTPATDSPPHTNGGLQHKWEITIVKTEKVILYAKDYSDAGKQAGDGEVTNVRRLD